MNESSKKEMPSTYHTLGSLKFKYTQIVGGTPLVICIHWCLLFVVERPPIKVKISKEPTIKQNTWASVKVQTNDFDLLTTLMIYFTRLNCSVLFLGLIGQWWFFLKIKIAHHRTFYAPSIQIKITTWNQ